MSEDLVSTPCPDAAQLTAYLEGRVSRAERTSIQRHLADCDTCREVVAEAARLLDATGTATVLPFWRRPKVQTVSAAALALAASVLLIVRPELNPFREPQPSAALVAAVGARRVVEARLTGGFSYGPLESTRRGELADDAVGVQLRSAAGLIRERAARTNDPDDLHAWGMAQILLGQHREAESTLSAALRSRPADAKLAADLAAARTMRVLADDAREELPGARESLDAAIRLDPSLLEPRFNKALLLERAGDKNEAIDAWATYLSLDAHSEWGQHAARRRDALQGATPR